MSLSTEPMIVVNQLCFDYPNQRALDHVSFSLESGSVTALVGPNGAGKTTLMRCIAGLETPTEGEISVAGVNVVEHPRRVHRQIGYLSDFFGLYEELTVAQCLRYAAKSQGVSAEAVGAAVARTAQRLDLSDRLEQCAGDLSRGLRQRLAIGQAIIHAPKLLILDEPASGLDPEARASLAELFRALQAEGMSLLVSSHILAELDQYSTHMLALRDGRVLEHRALAGASSVGAAAPRRLCLMLAQPHLALQDMLAGHVGVAEISAAADRAEFTLQGDAAAQAALLAHLVAAGLAVASFSELRENLQESYLRSIQQR